MGSGPVAEALVSDALREIIGATVPWCCAGPLMRAGWATMCADLVALPWHRPGGRRALAGGLVPDGLGRRKGLMVSQLGDQDLGARISPARACLLKRSKVLVLT